MKLNSLVKTTKRSQKRLGRGYGSGKGGHTSSRGAKGQKARNTVKLWFEGGQLPLTKRLPFQRGKGRLKSLKKDPLIVNLKHLNVLPNKSKVNLKTLIKYNVIRQKDAKIYPIKILGEGKLTKALSVELATSKAATKAIKKAGGSVSFPAESKKQTSAKPKPSIKKAKPAKPKSKKSTKVNKKD